MLSQMMLYVQNFLRVEFDQEEGQGLIEYALIVLLIAIAVIVVLGLLGTQVNAVFENIRNTFSTAQ